MAAHKPVGTGQTITIGAASTYVEFKQESPYVRIYAKGTDTFVAINTNPTADATGYYIPSNTSAILSMDKVRSNRVVGITTGVGETTLDFAEGTGSPVDVGQLVMLDVTGNSVLSFGPGVGVATANAAYVTSINSNLGQGGYNSTRITVDFDSQDLAASDGTFPWAQLHKVARVGLGSASNGGSGIAYVQQIQIAGDA
tara:strand:- start:602 stop:1195 length:594 start_codon:yes stop_codon:yes gene_type:complete